MSCCISNACFSTANDCLVVSSNTGTVHLFTFETLTTRSSEVLKNKELIASFNMFKGFKSYLPDMLSLPTSSMKLHLADKLECSWVAKEGTLLGPVAVFNNNHQLVIFLFIH